MQRQCVLDTETTGFNPKTGDKIVEIGVVELIDGIKTGRTFHALINPNRPIPQETTDIHGITDEDVKGKPIFKAIADKFIEFIDGSELIIHNLVFDIKFLNAELDFAGKNKILSYVSNARCSLELSRNLFPKPLKKKDETKEEEAYRKLGYSLDQMCDRLGVDRTHRVHHGALLDADLLADMFLAINKKFPLKELEEEIEQRGWIRPEIKTFEGVKLLRAVINESDLNAHNKEIVLMEKETKTVPFFSVQSRVQTPKI